jgi:hypothetical protein
MTYFKDRSAAIRFAVLEVGETPREQHLEKDVCVEHHDLNSNVPQTG